VRQGYLVFAPSGVSAWHQSRSLAFALVRVFIFSFEKPHADIPSETSTPLAANRVVPRLKNRKPEEPLEAHHVLVDLAPLLFVAAEKSVKFEGEGGRRASGTIPSSRQCPLFLGQGSTQKPPRRKKQHRTQKSTPTLRFLGNNRDLVLPFWVAVVAFAVIGGIG